MEDKESELNPVINEAYKKVVSIHPEEFPRPREGANLLLGKREILMEGKRGMTIMEPLVNNSTEGAQDVGDYVWMEWITGHPSKKLGSQLEGPYKVFERVGNACRLDLPASMKVLSVITINRHRRAQHNFSIPSRRSKSTATRGGR
jgi:hypothetical protein